VRAGGATEDLVSSQTIKTGGYSLNFSGNFFFKNGDVFKVTIKNVAASLVNANAYMYANVRRPSAEKISDSFAKYGSWNYNNTIIAESPTFGTKSDFVIPSSSLYNLYGNTNVSSPSMKAGVGYFIDENSDAKTPECGSMPFAGSSKMDLQYLGKPQSVDLLNNSGGAVTNPCTFSVSAAVDAEAGNASIALNLSGLEPKNTYAEISQNVNKISSNSDAGVLGVDVPLVLGEPGGYSYKEFNGKVDAKAQFSFLVNGVRKKTGLKISSASANLYYPINTSAGKSTFDGKGLELLLIDVSTGKIVTDATGKNEIGRMLPSSGSKEYVSFESVGFPDVNDGNYRLVLKLPDTLTEGVYLNASISVEKLNALVEPLDNSVLVEFAKRDSDSKVVPADWTLANYADPSKDNRKKVAMYETLRRMEEIRDTFHLAVNEVNPFTKSAPVKSNLNSTDFGTIAGCLGNEAKHWSDLTEHYYCLYAELRSCYTGAIRGTGPEMEKVRDEETAKGLTGSTLSSSITCRLPTMPAFWNPTTPAVQLTSQMRSFPVVPMVPPNTPKSDISSNFPTLRRYAYFMCSLPKAAVLPSETSPTNVIPGCLGSNKNFAYQPGDEERENFSWISSDASKGLLFRYIMDAPTFAFDDKDQQDIINAFWRVTQPDPSKPNSDCAKRPRRAIDPNDGSHCMPNADAATAGFKVQEPLQHPANR
jgi:hypothetical protein